MKRAREDTAILPVAKVPRTETIALLLLLPPNVQVKIHRSLALIARIALRLTCKTMCNMDTLNDDLVGRDAEQARRDYDTLYYDTKEAGGLLLWCTEEIRLEHLRWVMTFAYRWLEDIPRNVWVCWDVTPVGVNENSDLILIAFSSEFMGKWEFRIQSHGQGLVNPEFFGIDQMCEFTKPTLFYEDKPTYASVREEVMK